MCHLVKQKQSREGVYCIVIIIIIIKRVTAQCIITIVRVRVYQVFTSKVFLSAFRPRWPKCQSKKYVGQLLHHFVTRVEFIYIKFYKGFTIINFKIYFCMLTEDMLIRLSFSLCIPVPLL